MKIVDNQPRVFFLRGKKMSNIAISYGNLLYPFILSPFLLEFDEKYKKKGKI